MSITPSKWRPQGVDDLERNGWEVVRSATNYGVIAGPGAGKTELLAQRACYLLQTGLCPVPKRILAISFKRDAAENLRERVRQRSSTENARRFDSYTFDAFGKSLIDRFGQALPEWCRPDADYRIFFPKTGNYRDFLTRPPSVPPADLGGLDELQRIIPAYRFGRDHVAGDRLPEEGFLPTDIVEWARSLWWNQQVHHRTPSQLDFLMIGRLAELLLRVNPRIKRALQQTYSHVFLDEFQDTTYVQYDLLATAFFGTATVLTAVGDNKQQIMRWAGALSDPFGELERDISITRIPLIRNYRSSPELVEIQHRIALNIDPDVQEVESMSLNTMDGDVCSILDFRCPENEGRYLADLISDGIAFDGLGPRDFVILVKQMAQDYFEDLLPWFDDDIKLRNESDLQDLLNERLVKIFILFLRLGASRIAGDAWAECRDVKVSLLGIDPEDRRSLRRLDRDLHHFQDDLIAEMTGGPQTEEQFERIFKNIIDFLNLHLLALAIPEYQHQPNLDRVQDEFMEQISQRIEQFHTWTQLLDDLEGLDAVPLMTIHKSKGLEYHTVIFVGLDDNAWWSFRNEPAEGRSAFFVAFSRAEQRVLFTYCDYRRGTPGRRYDIASLYEILRESGVPRYKAP